MATRRQRERKARQRRWESLRSRNRVRGHWTSQTLSVIDEVRVLIAPDTPAFLATAGGLGGYRASLVERSTP